ncbi:type II secretion system protein [Campylobacter corcagiensis]|uniref:Prepilin-type N-terminal cleavage/methylation domain-containing protein n=1 Tax=Campylobacter corcagiensis TaxID=1448857 RepID=A0A7M1LEL3_9BACT|nr:prepilin-type N-terminal cleavage/methylation domain-containing protein [Campylobacter corcagiensis]QKF64850.1 type II secretion/transformation system, G protein [Campylobacter corcagiensis]QOQ86988.1 prepilin-type N-terminal cleavage/methylation domain-containing protein [Campylobacter corcagiensis]
MKNGFSMIELIFVIVILGILAAIALPRLSASRDDALIAVAKNDLSTALSDVIAYTISQGKYSTNIKDMTNVDFKNSSFKVKGVECLKFDFHELKVMEVTINRSGLCDRVLDGSAVEPYLKMDATLNGRTYKHSDTKSFIPLDSETISRLSSVRY